MPINQLGLVGAQARGREEAVPGPHTQQAVLQFLPSAQGGMGNGRTALAAEAGLGRELLIVKKAKMDQASG